MKRFLSLVLWFLPAACAGGASNTVITDSAGIRLIDNRSTDRGWSGTPRWTVSHDLSIGTDSGAVEFQFGRIGDLAVSPDGHIAVIDQLGGVVRVFDRTGTFVRSVGRSGRELPRRFRIFRVADDAIYGAARDDDGVERIIRLRLITG